MASSRSAVMVVCVLLLLLVVADVAKADLPQQQAHITGSRKHLRDYNTARAAPEGSEVEAADENLKARLLAETQDYTPDHNCSTNCKK